MTPDEAIAEVKIRAKGRTRFEGSPSPLDEVLVTEIQRLRDENANLDAAIHMADRTLQRLLPPARDTIELLAGIIFTNHDEAQAAHTIRQQWQALIDGMEGR